MKKHLIIIFTLLLTLLMGSSVLIADGQTNVVWRAEYFNNTEFTPPAVVRTFESQVNHQWGNGSPVPGMNADLFSARWTTTAFFNSGVYRFEVRADDEVRIYVDNNQLVIDTFGQGRPGSLFTTEVTLTEGIHTIQVDYREFGGAAFVEFNWAFDRPAQSSDLISTSWVAEYYNNQSLLGAPFAIFTESSPSHNWGVGAPLPNMSTDSFSARWTAVVQLEGTYLVEINVDDGVRFYVNNVPFISEWHDARGQTYSTTFSLPAGTHSLVVEYYENGGVAFLDFRLSEVLSESSVWLTQYYNNINLSGNPVTSNILTTPTSNWGDGSPSAAIPSDNFSARFTSQRTLEEATYRISVQADDGVRVFVDGNMVIDEWHNARDEVYAADVPLRSGLHSIVVEYFERGGLAFLNWDMVPIGDFQLVPPAVVQTSTTLTITTPLLNVRNVPSANNSAILRKVNEGETYPVLGRNADSTWWQIQFDDGSNGWVFGSFVSVANPEIVPITSESQRPTIAPTRFDLTAITTLNIRSRPSSRGALLGRFPRNASANIVARDNRTTWWYIEYNGLVGWVSGEGVILPPSIDLSQVPVRDS